MPKHNPETAELVLSIHELQFAQAGEEDGAGKEPSFSFILCHADKPNRNGDGFELSYLQEAAATAEGAKIDFAHDQSPSAVVGKVTKAEFQDIDGGRVYCEAILFTNDVEAARAAYRLLQEGIIQAVSMECVFTEAVCSVCEKTFTSASQYCTHLKKYKGGEFKGQAVTRWMRGVEFTGVGLLEKGRQADEGAVVTEVASAEMKAAAEAKSFDDFREYRKKEDERQEARSEFWDLVYDLESYLGALIRGVEEGEITDEQAQEKINETLTQVGNDLGGVMKKLVDAEAEASAEAATVNKEGNMADVKTEAKAPKTVEEFQKALADVEKARDEAEAKAKAASDEAEKLKAEKAEAEAKARAEELVELMEKRGVEFDDEARANKIEELAKLDEATFSALKANIEAFPEAKANADEEPDETPAAEAKADEQPEQKAEAKADEGKQSAQGAPKAVADSAPKGDEAYGVKIEKMVTAACEQRREHILG